MSFLMTHKRYWLIPLVIFASVIATLIYLAHEREATAPFVYGRGLEPVVTPRIRRS